MSALRRIALERLAEGGQVSGSALAAELGVTRSAVARQMARLRTAGWPISARRGEGYRLTGRLRPLRRQAVEAELAEVADRIDGFELLDQIDSTSTHLLEAGWPRTGAAKVCLAERQTAGRGRRGRGWLAPTGSSITFSVARVFEQAPTELAALSLVAGVAVVETLADRGIAGVRLKWPNDLVTADDAKLGGILVDMAGESAGPTRVVVGVGLNHDFAGTGPAGMERVAADLAAMVAELPARDALAGRLIAGLMQAFETFAVEGLAAFRARWASLDSLAGRGVHVHWAGATIEGRADGIDLDGALLVMTADGRQRFLSAEVSVRPCP